MEKALAYRSFEKEQKKDGICYIVGAGEFNASYCRPKTQDYVIAADAGYLFLQRSEIDPDLIVGDFDSMDGNISDKAKVIRLPQEKDDTDMLAAIRIGMEKGYKEFALLGGTGGRIDHTIANIQCLTYLSKRNCIGYLYAPEYEMRVVTNGSIVFPPYEQGLLAVFSMGDSASGVFLHGLKYPLTDATITNDFPIGVSNQFIGKASCIEVKNGSLLVVRYL